MYRVAQARALHIAANTLQQSYLFSVRGPCLEVKPELQRVLEQRNWEQGMKQRREAEQEKKNRSPLQQELLKRHQRLEEVCMRHVNVVETAFAVNAVHVGSTLAITA